MGRRLESSLIYACWASLSVDQLKFILYKLSKSSAPNKNYQAQCFCNSGIFWVILRILVLMSHCPHSCQTWYSKDLKRRADPDIHFLWYVEKNRTKKKSGHWHSVRACILLNHPSQVSCAGCTHSADTGLFFYGRKPNSGVISQTPMRVLCWVIDTVALAKPDIFLFVLTAKQCVSVHYAVTHTYTHAHTGISLLLPCSLVY